MAREWQPLPAPRQTSTQAVDRPPSHGRPLRSALRAAVEATLHADFSSVRVHADGTEGSSAASRLGVAGFAVGEQIAFAPGQFREEALDGSRLLVHELVHVLQQRRGGAAPQRGRGSPAEREAASIAAQSTRGEPPAKVAHGTAVGIACDEGVATMSAAHAGGAMGELDAAFILGQRGFKIVLGPGGPGGHRLTASGLDILAYNPASDELWIVDNKASGGTGRVASASAITTNLRANVAQASTEVLALPEFPEKAKVLAHLNAASSALAGKRKIPAKVRVVVTSAGGYHSGISKKLARRGVSFEDFTGAAARDAAKRDIAAVRAAGGKPGRSTSRPATAPTPTTAVVPAAPPPRAAPVPVAATPGTAPAGWLVDHPPSSRVPSSAVPKPPTAKGAAVASAKRVRGLVSNATRGLKGAFSPKVQLPLGALMSVMSALDSFDMARGGLSGEGFVLRDEIRSMGATATECAALATEYEGTFHEWIGEASTLAQVLALTGTPDGYDALWDTAAATLVELRGRRSDASDLLVAAQGVLATVDSRIAYATSLLTSSEALALAGMLGGTAVAAQVFAARQDLYRIRGSANSAVASLTQLVTMLDEDIATMEFYYQ